MLLAVSCKFDHYFSGKNYSAFAEPVLNICLYPELFRAFLGIQGEVTKINKGSNLKLAEKLTN